MNKRFFMLLKPYSFSGDMLSKAVLFEEAKFIQLQYFTKNDFKKSRTVFFIFRGFWTYPNGKWVVEISKSLDLYFGMFVRIVRNSESE